MVDRDPGSSPAAVFGPRSGERRSSLRDLVLRIGEVLAVRFLGARVIFHLADVQPEVSAQELANPAARTQQIFDQLIDPVIALWRDDIEERRRQHVNASQYLEVQIRL